MSIIDCNKLIHGNRNRNNCMDLLRYKNISACLSLINIVTF